MYFTVLSALGVAYSYGYVVVHDPHLVVGSLKSERFNDVRAALPASAGIQTLRYAACLAGGIALFEIGRRRLRWVHFVNLGFLVLTAAVAARICIIIAVIVAIALAARHLQRRRVSLRRVLGTTLLGCVLLFLVLTPLNYVRNAGTYRDAYGVHDPLLMNAYEMIRYLGMPFQASVSVANHVGTWPKLPRKTAGAGMGAYLLPTYVKPVVPTSVARAEVRYRQVTTITQSQTTNSVLASAYGVFGLAAFGVLGVVALIAALVAGHASRYESYVFLGGPVIAYCFAEYWRVYAFNAGIVQFLIGSVAFWGICGEVVMARTSKGWQCLSQQALRPRRRREREPDPPMT
jgi:hypothetical protein